MQIPFSFYFGTDATVFSDSLSPHKDFDFGTWDKVPADCAQKIGGGWWYNNMCDPAVSSNLNGIYRRCGGETEANIHWGRLVPVLAEDSAPTSAEMKIRPVDFFFNFQTNK